MPERPRLTPAMADVRRAVREGFDSGGVTTGDLVLVACSGGADSMALAGAAQFEGARSGILVGAVIVEHGLQDVTKVVAQQTAAKLQALGLDPVRVVEVQVADAAGNFEGGTEAAARTARYSALQAAAIEVGAKAVLLGHTLNDQAETVLLGLARGSGIKSLAGMRALTDSGAGFVWLRPLLAIDRQTTEDCCTDSGLEFWSDPHNVDPQFARVRVRTEALPVLEFNLGPGIAQALARSADLLQADMDYLEQAATATYHRLVKLGATGITISCKALDQEPIAISSRVIHQALTVFGGSPGKKHVDEVLQLVLNWHGQKELTLPGVRVVRNGDDLTFKSSKTLRPGAC